MFYSAQTQLWGFIAHIPLAIMLLMFISRQVTLKDKGEGSIFRVFDSNNKKILTRYAVGGIFGLILLGTLSPVSRLLIR